MAVRVSKADFEEKVLKEKLPVLVDFYSDSSNWLESCL